MRNARLVLAGATLLAAGVTAGGCGGDVTVSSGGSAGAPDGGGGATSTSTSTSTSEGGGGSTTTTSTGGITMTTTPTGTGGDAILAVHKLFVGDKTPDGMMAINAWKVYGLNLDGLVTDSQNLAGHCKPANGANPSAVFPDGNDGIDNSFGKTILPMMMSLDVEYSDKVNQAIHEGRYSLLFHLQGIGPGQTGLFPTKIYGGSFGPNILPNWSGTDVWPVRSDSVEGGSLESPKVSYPTAEVNIEANGDRVWRSLGVAEITLRLESTDYALLLPVHNAHMWMTLSPDNTQAVRGIIAGVLDPQGFISSLADVLGSYDQSLCPPSATFESIAQQILQAQDIMIDGTNNSAATCNGISIGLGFEADAALLGGVFAPPPEPDPCGP